MQLNYSRFSSISILFWYLREKGILTKFIHANYILNYDPKFPAPNYKRKKISYVFKLKLEAQVLNKFMFIDLV